MRGATAGAANSAPPPASLTNCSGHLAADSAAAKDGEPFLTDYTFSCSTGITAYTILVDLVAGHDDNLDDFGPSPSVVGPPGAPSPTESVTCEGATPSSGVNCNAGAGGVLTAGNKVVGSVDLSASYCKYLPAKAKPDTLAVPRANVQLLVSDETGAEDGPFDLKLNKACPKVTNVVPARSKKTSKSTRKAARRTGK